MSVVPEIVKRRLAFQKSFSQEHGGSWRRRSLIEDAKFETVTNIEYEKQKKKESRSESISEEEEDAFVENGEVESSLGADSAHKASFIFTLNDGIGSLARIIRSIEANRCVLDHIETRVSTPDGDGYEAFLMCRGTRESILGVLNCLKQNTSIADLKYSGDTDLKKTEIWLPNHISDLDRCNHVVTKFEPELDLDHPGFTDVKYKQRRTIVADFAFNYRHGDRIPKVQYSQEELKTWNHVYTNLKKLFPTHACKEHQQMFQRLEDSGLYSEHFIPQLDDVSNFLKRTSGFQLRPVAGLLSARDFLSSLAFRVFQCTQYVRHGSKPDYSPEPDCIHELLGHVPMLSHPPFARFSQDLGIASLGASDEDIEKFATLYWFTVEFGVLKQDGELRAYGAGTLSSYGELLHALSDKPLKKAFDPRLTSVQTYTDEDFQPIYFIVESFDDMMSRMRTYAAAIKRPCEYRFDPFTNTVQKMSDRDALLRVTNTLRADMEVLQNAVDRLQFNQIKEI